MKKHQKRRHRWWVHDILEKRRQYGTYHHLVQELQLDGERFQQYFRLSREQFSQVLFLIRDTLIKDNRIRDVISPRERLVICLRFLATGESFRSIAFSYRVGFTTVSRIVSEVCKILWDRLAPIHLAFPESADYWRLIASNFASKWNFPHCLGALDGKHVVMRAPDNTGSLYFNYKGSFSTVLMALVDANLKFIYIDVGSYGRNSDGGIFAHSSMGKAMATNALKFPPDARLPYADNLGPLPYVVVADEAFPLSKHILRPFPGRSLSLDKRIFNYRLSRARRIVENAFGVLAARWRIFHAKMAVAPQLANDIVKATIVLHNLLQRQTTPAEVTALLHEVEDIDVAALQDLENVGGRQALEHIRVRDAYMNYFCNIAPLQWQEKHAERGRFY
ncbi:hypothetical protein ACOMHN_022783 [Nucella lapillus]